MDSSDIAGIIDRFINQLGDLERHLILLRQQKRGITGEVIQDAVLGLGTAILSDEFPGSGRYVRKYGRKLLRQQSEQQHLAQEKTIEGQFEGVLNQVKSFLATISIRKLKMPEPNSHLLLRKVDDVNRFVDLHTRIRHALTILKWIMSQPLVYNSEIEKLPGKTKTSDAYAQLKSLENSLREFIQARLSAIDPNWWGVRVPHEVRKRAISRKSKDKRLYPWHVQKDLPPIYYVDFADYARIIAMSDNWDQVFGERFKEKEFIVTKLKELEPIRNAIAHSRDISAKDNEKLKLYLKEIIPCLK